MTENSFYSSEVLYNLVNRFYSSNYPSVATAYTSPVALGLVQSSLVGRGTPMLGKIDWHTTMYGKESYLYISTTTC